MAVKMQKELLDFGVPLPAGWRRDEVEEVEAAAVELAATGRRRVYYGRCVACLWEEGPFEGMGQAIAAVATHDAGYQPGNPAYTLGRRLEVGEDP
jgi:hypothetical protein